MSENGHGRDGFKGTTVDYADRAQEMAEHRRGSRGEKELLHPSRRPKNQIGWETRRIVISSDPNRAGHLREITIYA